MNATTLLILCSLAVYRCARLVAMDSISERPRGWLMRRAGRVNSKLSDLFSCPYCVGLHLAGWLTLVVFLMDTNMPLPILWWPAIGGGQSILTALDQKLSSH